MCAAPDPPSGSGARRHSRGRSAGVGWWQPPARSARSVPAAEPPGRVRRRAPQPGRAPADALTTPVGPALRGEVLAALDRGASPRGIRTPQAAGTNRSGSGASRRTEPGRARDQDRWMTDARLMLDAGWAAFKAAKAKDVAALEALSDQMYEACTTCHQHYRPGYGKRPPPGVK